MGIDHAPDRLAMNLDRRRSRLVDVLVPSFSAPFHAGLVRAGEAAAAAGCLAVVQSAHGLVSEKAQRLRQMRSLNAAGAVVVSMDAPESEAPLADLARRIPMVLADIWVDLPLPFVGTGNARSVPLIAGHLCDTDSLPVLLAMPAVNRNAAERRATYETLMRGRGLAPQVVEPDPVHAVRFGGWGFEEAGLRAGRDQAADLCIAGHDDNPLSAYLCPPLTTVRQDVGAIGGATGRAAVGLLPGGSRRAGVPRQGIGRRRSSRTPPDRAPPGRRTRHPPERLSRSN